MKFSTVTKDYKSPIQFVKNDKGEDVGAPLKWTGRVAIPETEAERIALAGTEDRLNEIIGARNTQRLNSLLSDARLKNIKSLEELNKHIAEVTTDMEDINAPLSSSRGSGVNARAQKFDDLTTALANAKSPAEKLAALEAMGL